MAELMGGEVALEAKWLNGSAFWLELPLAEPKAG
jgi:signal transduction histidine kinase